MLYPRKSEQGTITTTRYTCVSCRRHPVRVSTISISAGSQYMPCSKIVMCFSKSTVVHSTVRLAMTSMSPYFDLTHRPLRGTQKNGPAPRDLSSKLPVLCFCAATGEVACPCAAPLPWPWPCPMTSFFYILLPPSQVDFRSPPSRLQATSLGDLKVT